MMHTTSLCNGSAASRWGMDRPIDRLIYGRSIGQVAGIWGAIDSFRQPWWMVAKPRWLYMIWASDRGDRVAGPAPMTPKDRSSGLDTWTVSARLQAHVVKTESTFDRWM